MKNLRMLVLLGVFSAWANLQSSAAPLYLVPGLPDFGSSFVTVSYDFSSGTFHATGYTDPYTNPGGISSADDGYTGPFVPDITDPSFDLTAHITSAGVLTSGTVTILGSMDGTGDNVETLLTGSLNTGSDGVAFGSSYFAPPNTGGDYFEFKFKVTGGDSTIVADFGGVTGAYDGGIILAPWFGHSDVLFNGSWTASFSNENSNNGVADTVLLVPEPSSVLLVSAGVLCMVAYRRLNAPRA